MMALSAIHAFFDDGSFLLTSICREGVGGAKLREKVRKHEAGAATASFKF
jgi:hypothetical protein